MIICRNEFWDVNRTKDEVRRGGYFDVLEYTDNIEPMIETERKDIVWPQLLNRDTLDISAFGALVFYLRTLKLDKDLVSAKNFHMYDIIRAVQTLVLDGQTLLNLEIFQNTLDSSERGTLFKLLDHT